MFDASMLMLLTTLTPTHPGSGTELSYVDLPIQREIHTGFPKIEAATLKGCIRKEVTDRHQERKEEINRIFGSPNGGEFASAAIFSDARLLFFPVKSVVGVFAWITCPLALERFLDECGMIGSKTEFPEVCRPDKGTVSVTDERSCRLIQQIKGKNKIMLEDYTYSATSDHNFKIVVEVIQNNLPDNRLMKKCFTERAVLLSDDEFADFVRHSTEVNARIRVNAGTGTVADNALFTEEMLPSDCILYSLLFFSDTHLPQPLQGQGNDPRLSASEVSKEFKLLFDSDIFQIGADSTLGKGIVMKKIVDGRDIHVTEFI